MSISIKDCEMNIRRDERKVYKTVTTQKYVDEATGEEKTDFMNILVGFRKGVEVKNKSRIKVVDGFLTHIRFETEELNENGNPIIKRIPKLMIMEFEIIEEGIDEDEQVRTYNNDITNNEATEMFGTFNNSYGDDLPF